MHKVKQILKLIQGYLHFIRLTRKLNSVWNEVEIVFFFPYYHTGGAERVHSSIVAALAQKKILVIFTKASATKALLPSFSSYANYVELNSILNKRNVRLNLILNKCLLKKINTSTSLKKVFGANSDYFYELLPSISTHIKRLDLFHAFSYDDYRASLVVESAPYIDHRIVINQEALNTVLCYYKIAGVDSLQERIQIISNGVILPNPDLKIKKELIRIGFIGRWSEEKRPEIFLKTAQNVRQQFPEVQFFMAGSGTISNQKIIESHGVVLLGDIHDTKILNDVYASTSILVLTSVYEGFPMVFMEGMSFGCIPVTTNVGGVDSHIKNGITGYLIDELEEDKIIANLVTHLCHLIKQPSLIQELSNNCRKYARAHFSIQQFNEAYQKLLN